MKELINNNKLFRHQCFKFTRARGACVSGGSARAQWASRAHASPLGGGARASGDPSSALGLVLVGAHEVHPVDRDVLLLDGLLHAPLVLPEGLAARVAAPVALQELLREPAVEALVVVPLEVGAGLPDAVHRRRLESRGRREGSVSGRGRRQPRKGRAALRDPP